MAGLIEVRLSGDLTKPEIISQTLEDVSSRLKDNRISPLFRVTSYDPLMGETYVTYYFENNVNLPEKSKLASILEGIKFKVLNFG